MPEAHDENPDAAIRSTQRVEVESVGQYSKDDFPTELVYGATDDAALRLITCGGSFDSAERSYRDNIVVFATLVGSHQASPSS